MLDLGSRAITALVFVGLLLAVIVLPDLVAVVIIAAGLTGLALRGLQEKTTKPRERTWRRGESWWR